MLKFLALFLKIILYMSFIGKSLQIKQIIAEYLISSSLELSHYLIPTDKDYSIHMWIRILEDN